MASLATYRRKHQPGNRSRRTSLFAIPEDHSCREWQIAPSSPSHLSKNFHDTAISELDSTATAVCYKMIDMERENTNLRALARSEKLQKLARRHANQMASNGQVVHSVSKLAQLQDKLQSKLVGENVQRGKTPIDMHKATMERLDVNRGNLLCPDFHEYGVAASRGTDGKLYVCHLFR